MSQCVQRKEALGPPVHDNAAFSEAQGGPGRKAWQSQTQGGKPTVNNNTAIPTQAANKIGNHEPYIVAHALELSKAYTPPSRTRMASSSLA